MPASDRMRSATLLTLTLLFVTGCGAADEEEVAGGTEMAAEEASAFDLPPAGTTGTPADDATDPALRDLPNPNPVVVAGWGPLPEGREWGASAGVDIGPDGTVWAYDRCGGTGFGPGGNCHTNGDVHPIVQFDPGTGELLNAFGAGELVVPHGIHVDSVGNVWVTDFGVNEEGTKGHQVFKFSPEGEVLMRLGMAGMPGNDSDHFNQPNDVITAPDGTIFVADGHSGQSQNPPPGSTGRIMKFTPEGEFIMQWGEIGNEPGNFRTPHALAFDSRGRLYVADRGNHRIQIFDHDGNLLDTYYQYSRISDIFITSEDTLYAIDSESSPTNHPGWISGVRIGPAAADTVLAFIPPYEGDERPVAGEGVAVDAEGHVYAAEGPASRPFAGGGLTRYSRD